MTEPGAVRLTVAELDSELDFYRDVLGLNTIGEPETVARLGANGEPLVELAAHPGAAPRPPATTGLFHLAVLVPDRPALGRALRRVLEAGRRLSGAADHLVSEALYLSDPEGNGIEIYRDRPREEWTWRDGKLQMATLPLDLEAILEAGGETAEPTAPPETRIGHVHLQVADIGDSRAFYEGLLGLDVTVDDFPGALFLSSGGYHHHIGLNTWAGEGAPPPPEGARGLRHYELLVTPDELEEISARLSAAGSAPERTEEGLLVRDPSANAILLRT